MRSERSTTGMLVALAVAGVAAFVFAPATLAGGGYGGWPDDRPLVDATTGAVVEYWYAGRAVFPSALQQLVDYWSRYHAAKAVIAALLVVVFGALATGLRRAGRTAGSVIAGLCAVGSITLAAANIQGALAPFASLLSLLPVGRSGPALAGVVDQITTGLSASTFSPALAVMVADFGRYHLVVGIVAATICAVFGMAAGVSWRGKHVVLAASAGVLAAGFGLLAAINVDTATAPAHALLLFFGG